MRLGAVHLQDEVVVGENLFHESSASRVLENDPLIEQD